MIFKIIQIPILPIALSQSLERERERERGVNANEHDPKLQDSKQCSCSWQQVSKLLKSLKQNFKKL